MNYLQKYIAIAVPTILLSAPAYAHGSGLFLIFIGLPLLGFLFLIYIGLAIYTAPAKKRFATFIQSLFVGAFWVAVFIGPWLKGSIENVISDYEVIWAIAIPLLLFVSSWILRKRYRKT